MTVGEFLKTTTAALEQAGVESARLDTLILLEDALKKDRAILLAHPEAEIPTPLFADLHKKRTQREQHMPLAYIRGKAPFYGREFLVDEHVLIPRPETEMLIELLKKYATAGQISIADVGTGSGCLGITAGLELPGSQVYLYDIDTAALAVAAQNAKHLQIQATCERHDLLAGVTHRHNVVLANLPYVPEHMTINRAATHEPAQALFSGPDGLDHYKRFWAELAALLQKPELVITETLPSQHHTNAMLARAAGYYLAERQGFAEAFSL
jgi:release factor glutamine methyltransferase